LISLIVDSEARVLFLGPEFVGKLREIHDRLPETTQLVAFGNAEGYLIDYKDLRDKQPEDEPEPRVAEDDPVVIFYTSGTTGAPRGAVYNHAQKLENTLVKALDIGLEFGDRHLVVLPMFHIGGDSHIWPFFINGGCNVIIPEPRFDPNEMLRIINAEKITDVHIVPTQLVALLDLPDEALQNLPSLKRIWYAASPMPVEVLKRALSVFGPIFLQGYGQTESGCHTTVLRQADHAHSYESDEEMRILASCGQPALGVQMRVVDADDRDVEPGTIGEMIIRSKRIMTEYWRRPKETAETIKDEWLRTGDLGYYDEEGYIYIADRKKDMIISGGENVFPKEVEEILYRHPAVEEAAIIGIPDSYWVEKVHAVITLKKNARADEEEIITFCRDRMAGYKAPKSVEFVEELPKSPQGKILKKELRAKYRTD
jgi:acyl-CoA synthetase (AMP-forming)/AMP-acid ligase II